MSNEIKPEDLSALKALLENNPFPAKSEKPLIAEFMDEDDENSPVVIREEGSSTPKLVMSYEDYMELREHAPKE